MYKFLQNHSENEEKAVDWYIFYLFVFMLYNHFSSWQINLLLRPALGNQELKRSCKQRLEAFPCLMDDFRYNGKASIFYDIAVKKNMLEKFCWTSGKAAWEDCKESV